MGVSKTVPLISTLLKVSRDFRPTSLLELRFFNTNAPVYTREVIVSHPNINYMSSHFALTTPNSIRCISTRLTSTSVGEEPITKEQADELVLRLTSEERTHLFSALQEFEANKVKAEYEGQLAARRWRSRFGRPSKLPTLGNVDPTGTYCHLSDDWLKKKYAENVPPPTLQQLLHVASHNAIPFIGFGFLDNAIMIIAGDQIEVSLGAVITISTMAAAALGNTISDVLGIGSAWYVEQLAAKIGMKPPNLSPIQLDMSAARTFSNLGRAIGIIVGCLLGMLPLLFMNEKMPEKDKKPDKTPQN